jgi:hypothetical protein
MINIDTLFQNPTMAGISASVFAILYFFLMTINANLPPALLFSLAIGYFVYTTTGSTARTQSGGAGATVHSIVARSFSKTK